RIFWQIVLPAITPALGAWGTISFIARWNDFMWPLLLMRSKEMYTLMVSIAILPISEGLSTPWPVVMAGASVGVFPLILVYVILQRFQISGLMLGAVKG
ncbi:MAG: carbohydrate ABC transporter permease, partial [Spirochaetota bacterium]